MTIQKGFTLIELVVVIVILGILAAVAIPKFVDLEAQASQAAVEGVAGGLSSANSINYALEKASGAGLPIADCNASDTLLQGPLPAGYTIDSAAVAVDAAVTCTLNGDNGTTATFTAIGVN